jgi:hypothetical protein
MRRSFFIILLGFMLALNGIGQEMLTTPGENPVIKQVLSSKDFKSYKIVYTAPINLPFFDDFKQKGVFPDTSRWMDNNVFINTDFPVFPPSWGAATFDAIDAKGDIYGDANPLQFLSDVLTSKPIRLDSIFLPSKRAITPADSVYLSFYYQPQGRGNDPQPLDSLVLEFGHFTADSVFSYIDSIEVPVSIFIGDTDTIFPGDKLSSPCDENWWTQVFDTLFYTDYVTLPCDSVFVPQAVWEWAWSSEGMSLDTFRVKNDSDYFKQVLIPIKDDRFFRNDFQFRFYNYASIASDNLQSWQSNCDYWNVDYIYLNIGRSKGDTTYKDITFVERAPSFLSEFSAMPFSQYRNDPTNVMKGGFEMYISNLDKINETASYSYEVFDDAGGLVYDYSGGNYSLEVFSEYGFVTYLPFAYPPVNGIFPPFGSRDSAYFDIIHYLIPIETVAGLGDTVQMRQNFSNYYAYDDGTPEFGYGLTPAGAKLAYQFTLSQRDTLRAIEMFFNKTLTNANEQFFNLAIWKDLNGTPGDLVYIQENEKPVFSDNLYQFHTYYLDSAVPVQGTFYVGWIQETYHNLNVGFDSYNDASSHIFYNTTGTWDRTSYKGSLLIRPILGKNLIEVPVQKSTSADLFRIAPNPCRNGIIELKFCEYAKGEIDPQMVNLKDEIVSQMVVEVFNLLGQKVFATLYQPQINLSHLNEGVYIVRINNSYSGQTMVEKLVISK